MNTAAMQLQRDQALACLVLALGLSLAVFVSVFAPGDAPAIANARSQVAAHEALLRSGQMTLQVDREALAAVRASLERTRRP